MWHINSWAPNIVTQSWDLGKLPAPPSSAHPHPKNVQQSWKNAEKGQQGWAKLWNGFCGRSSSVWPSPSCCYSLGGDPKTNVLTWRPNSLNSKGVSHVCCHNPLLGCWEQIPSDDSPQLASSHTMGGKSPLALLILHSCPSVCGIMKVILVGSRPFYTDYCIWYKVSGVTWSKVVLIETNTTQPVFKRKQ